MFEPFLKKSSNFVSRTKIRELLEWENPGEWKSRWAFFISLLSESLILTQKIFIEMVRTFLSFRDISTSLGEQWLWAYQLCLGDAIPYMLTGTITHSYMYIEDTTKMYIGIQIFLLKLMLLKTFFIIVRLYTFLISNIIMICLIKYNKFLLD